MIELVEAAQQGNQKAFRELYECNVNKVNVFILKRCQDELLAYEVTLEAFCKGFMHINNYKPNCLFSTWICAIAKNTLVNHQRKTNSKKMHLLVDFHKSNVYDSRDLSANAEEDLIRIDIAAKLAKCLNMLSPSFKKIIELRFYEELKYEEIAIELDIPLHTVKARLSRAKVDLRKKYLANNSLVNL